MSELRGLDPAAVGAWMIAHVPDCQPPVEFELIAGGHSNLTFGARDGSGSRYVVRRGPLGVVTGGAHDMSREYRAIAALGPSAVPVAQAIALCEDESVNGSPFYVMSHAPGAVIATEVMADVHLPDRRARRRAGEQVIDVLADLHTVDIAAVGLGGSARRDGFLDRQLRRFTAMWHTNATRDLPIMESLARRLAVAAPAQQCTGIVHGDYRIGNLMLDDRGTVTAVLDWELWTIGDVLADVGFVLNNWYEPDDPAPLVFMDRPPTVTGEYGTRSEALARYVERTRFDVSGIEYYRAFSHWRMGVMAEGVKRRYESAQMASQEVDFGHLDRRVLHLAQLADHHLRAVEGRVGTAPLGCEP